MGIEAINPFELPLLNTVLLLSRGTLYGLVATVFLALVFTGLQAVEYKFSTFSISDGAFGSCFYFATGFHGLTNVALFIYLFITFLIKPTDPLDTTDPTDPTDPPLLLERFSESLESSILY
ncbi:Cytochrome c oxidase subunit 3 [Golovinomyces cichoracearum]|uniref:Cytochrome c oxidase subunit 3 n=1 Tax=Golovinomyces cichoracearum TaxID=62708 RepID=A0A420IAP3_9PEZI|nr:Cytochrome c oxidase subunit 3 [Golovinomyces cichoracearum]RKF71584.1 Cytochrome c oxidase subunit 3 [Golovinomyces cichoracearum]RKF74086.1 Cytochrome c oxidase subunit 3 [Golovinomyces cichoracearum]